MSKYQEALERIIEIKHLTSRKEQIQYCNLLQELVEKETPMKPKSKLYGITGEGETFMYHYCPICGFYSVEKDYANYCPNCGQKLDWSDWSDSE